MPTKKKKKKQGEAYDASRDFELSFTDVTMIEGEGKYALVKKLMDKDTPGGWRSSVVKTTLTVSSQFGQCAFRLDFYPDRRVAVVGYMPSVGDMYVNPDIRCLTAWCQANGWEVPTVTDSVIKDNIRFWKHMWNALLIDSDYLDEKYGIRKSLDMRAMQDESDRQEPLEEVVDEATHD